MNILYKTDVVPTAEQVIALYKKAKLPRPVDDKERMTKMYQNSNLVITAWNKDQLIGVCRCITDFVWTCYLADLAVDPGFQKEGLGKKLIALTREKVGEQAMILLLSVPTAMEYYPKVGFTKEDRAFAIPRKR